MKLQNNLCINKKFILGEGEGEKNHIGRKKEREMLNIKRGQTAQEE